MTLDRTLDRVQLELTAGMPVVLLRVPRVPTSVVADGLAARLGAGPLVDNPTSPAEGWRLLDARGWPQSRFEAWDAVRGMVGPGLVVLLDVGAADAITRAAPQFTSWAGGIRLPLESGVRPARSEQELAVGASVLARALAADPTLRTHSGETIAVDLLTERVFLPRSDASALELAQEKLDQGVVYVVRLEP